MIAFDLDLIQDRWYSFSLKTNFRSTQSLHLRNPQYTERTMQPSLPYSAATKKTPLHNKHNVPDGSFVAPDPFYPHLINQTPLMTLATKDKKEIRNVYPEEVHVLPPDSFD